MYNKRKLKLTLMFIYYKITKENLKGGIFYVRSWNEIRS